MAAPTLLATAHAGDAFDDATLLASAAAGNQFAWRRIVGEYEPLVRSVARSFRLQSADVADVVQMTWLRLLQNLDTIRQPDRLAGWLAVTATRESLAVLRKASKQQLVPAVDEIPDGSDEPATRAEARDSARQLWAIVAELPPRQRVLLVALFRDEIRSYTEVAAGCAIPVGSIGPTRARALSHLRRKLAEHRLDPSDL